VGGRRPGEGALNVRRDLHRVAGQGLVHEEPRADHSRRTVALPAQLVAALRAHRAAHPEERITAGPLWQDHDLVFAQANGRPIESMSDWRSRKDLLSEADVREARLHDGRHTAATLLLPEGVHPGVVMEVLGHARMRTTTDTCSHVIPALGRDAADRMGSALWD
jgi:integrase